MGCYAPFEQARSRITASQPKAARRAARAAFVALSVDTGVGSGAKLLKWTYCGMHKHSISYAQQCTPAASWPCTLSLRTKLGPPKHPAQPCLSCLGLQACALALRQSTCAIGRAWHSLWALVMLRVHQMQRHCRPSRGMKAGGVGAQF